MNTAVETNDKNTTLANGELISGDRAEAEYVNLTVMSRAKNFNRWTYEFIRPFLGNSILELGSGFGTFSRMMLDDKKEVFGLDINQKHTDHAKKNCPDAVFLLHDITSGIEALNGKKFDTMISLNVLEHIENDKLAMKNVTETLLPNGKAVILVPAHPIIYDELDRMSGHFRRYTKKTATELVTQAGLKVTAFKWFNPWSLPALLYKSRVQKIDRLSPSSIDLYDRLVPLLKLIERAIPMPIGQSILVVGEKK